MQRPNPFQRSKRSEKIPVDGAYVGRFIQEAACAASIALQVTKHNEQVQRASEWICACRQAPAGGAHIGLGRYRHAGKDYERYCETEQCVIEWVMAAALLQRLAPGNFPETCRKRRI